jgi:nicotinamide-nucleotide amidase
MQAEILMIGTELLIGQIQDTNATFMAQTLAENGINLYQKTTVGDNRERIIAAIAGALTRSDVVLCSGGLGPTEDDITRESLAELLGRPLEYHEELFEEVAARFAHLRIPITDNNKKQAMLPQGASFIDNPHGTAPGILVEDERGTVVCMPGVPRELYSMLEERVIPYLRKRFGISGVLHYRVLKVRGMGESRVDSMMGDLIATQTNPTVGLLASRGVVRIRIAARAESIDEANALIDPVDKAIRERLPEIAVDAEDDKLENKG